MAFFDDLGKKLSQAGQSAIQKTKDMTDIARINGLISDEEKKLNNTYYQIGKLYASLHAKDYEPDFAGMVTATFESEAKIKEYKQQIQDIKGVVRCEKCGAEVANHAAFCNSCGAPIPKQAPSNNPNQIKCTGCGAMVDKSMRFCTTCGRPTADMAAAAPSRRCPGCGAEITEETPFCTQCGTRLG